MVSEIGLFYGQCHHQYRDGDLQRRGDSQRVEGAQRMQWEQEILKEKPGRRCGFEETLPQEKDWWPHGF